MQTCLRTAGMAQRSRAALLALGRGCSARSLAVSALHSRAQLHAHWRTRTCSKLPDSQAAAACSVTTPPHSPADGAVLLTEVEHRNVEAVKEDRAHITQRLQAEGARARHRGGFLLWLRPRRRQLAFERRERAAGRGCCCCIGCHGMGKGGGRPRAVAGSSGCCVWGSGMACVAAVLADVASRVKPCPTTELLRGV